MLDVAVSLASLGQRGYVIPRPHPELVTRRMLVMERLDGFAFDDHASQKEDWTSSWINAPTGRIAGGADEMLLNTIAEKILGLPQDHRPDKGVPFNQIPA